MKGLTIFLILMLSVWRLAIAQQLERFEGEVLEYSLTASLFGIVPDSAGRAFLRCLPTEDGGLLLSFHGFGSAYGMSADDSAAVLINRKGLVQEIMHSLPKSGQERWQMDYVNLLIYHSRKDSLFDTLEMEHWPVDALLGLYSMRTTKDSPIKVGFEKKFNIIGHDSDRLRSAWKPAEYKVVEEEKKKVQGKKIACWKVVITLDPQDNLFRGRKVTLWFTNDERLIPVEVKTGIKFLLFPVISVKGELVTPLF